MVKSILPQDLAGQKYDVIAAVAPSFKKEPLILEGARLKKDLVVIIEVSSATLSVRQPWRLPD